MADQTKIEWTDATWNPITGCSLVSDGCRNCYAAELAATRLKTHPSRAGLARRNAAGVAKFTGDVRLNEAWLCQPTAWHSPRRIFVCAHGDLFHEKVPDDWIDKVFAIMALCPGHTFQVLTKRPERMRAYLKRAGDDAAAWVNRLADAVGALGLGQDHYEAIEWAAVPLPNVWLGVSVEDQVTADTRLPYLQAAPAALRFVSAEPLLKAVDLGPWLDCLGWVIVGGESGRHARPMHPDWARTLRDQCEGANVAFLFKQWGAWLSIGQMADGASDGLYRSSRQARNGEDQDTIDDLYGRRCRVPTLCLHNDGQHCDVLSAMAFGGGVGAQQAFMVGKGKAGRLLDGAAHDGFPEVAE